MSEPYSKSVYRVPFLLDVYADNERQAMRRIHTVVTLLADKEERHLAQIGFSTVEARKQIAGACIYVDQLRRVVAPITPQPLPSLEELITSSLPDVYRAHPEDQLAFADTGTDPKPASEASSEIVPGRGSAAE